MKPTSIRNFLSLIFILFLFQACNIDEGATYEYERAHAPWAVRSVLDDQPRMLSVALNDNLWAAYSAEDGTLYKVWKGGVNFDGAVYTTAHGPQPSTLGDAYFVNAVENPWEIRRGEQKSTPTIQYKGHEFKKGQVYIKYHLQDGDATVTVHERPEYVTNESGSNGFERQFTVEGLPSGAALVYKMNLSSVSSERNIQTDGELSVIDKKDREYKSIKAFDMDAELKLNANATTTITTYFTRPLIENENKVVGAEEEEERPLGYRLIARNDCKTCHNTYRQTIGPAYIEVARKYTNNEANIAMLTSKVINGGSGVWGAAAMNAHPEVPESDIKAMVEYVMTLDAEEEAEAAAAAAAETPADLELIAGEEVAEVDLFPGVIAKVFVSPTELNKVADLDQTATPVFEGIIPEINAQDADLEMLGDNFGIVFNGYIKITKSNNYVFRLESDDGSILTIDDQVIIDHDGLHGADARDGEIALSAGYHPFKLEYFQKSGGKSVALKWRSFDQSREWKVIGTTSFVHHKDDKPGGQTGSPMQTQLRIPGDGFKLEAMHPSYTLNQARPEGFAPKVAGMDFMSDGRLVVSTWDAEGGVYLVENHQSDDPSQIQYKKIASGLAEPLGLKVVDDEIYILQKQELTKLIDHNGDDIIDEYETVSNEWMVSSNFHEFAFGLVYKEGWFYGTLAIAIMPGGASRKYQTPHRGKVFRVNKETGEFQLVAEGLRTPNGIGIGVDNEIFVADNQGDWLPSSKILHIQKGDFFGSRAVDSARVAGLEMKPPVVWLPQDEIGNSPTTPSYINDGPYKGQMIHGEVTHGGVKRVFVEEVNGEYQGAVFRFIQGLEAGVNRLVWGPDGSLYIGGVGSSGNWQHNGTLWYGLQRMKYQENKSFEMLAVRAKSNGLEIEMTKPLALDQGWDPAAYDIQQWRYVPTNEYGGPKVDQEKLKVLSANISEDRTKIFLEIAGMKKEHVIYVHLPNNWVSEDDTELWTTEAWYTLNQIPTASPGFVTTAPDLGGTNQLSAAEQADGWKLLFDGENLEGWRNFNKTTIGKNWVIEDGAIHLNAEKKGSNGWQAEDGGDIVFDEEFENFELRLDWKIGDCGNSGIMYLVQEGEDFSSPWNTGPEMQVLDNSCHPDAKIETHRAGDLYDMIQCKYVTVKPAGQWNTIRLKIENGKLEQWQNGRKVVETELFNEAWKEMIANSKFKDMPGFGSFKKGKISLQDHSDPVWFRNIKIKNLDQVQ